MSKSRVSTCWTFFAVSALLLGYCQAASARVLDPEPPERKNVVTPVGDVNVDFDQGDPIGELLATLKSQSQAGYSDEYVAGVLMETIRKSRSRQGLASETWNILSNLSRTIRKSRSRQGSATSTEVAEARARLLEELGKKRDPRIFGFLVEQLSDFSNMWGGPIYRPVAATAADVLDRYEPEAALDVFLGLLKSSKSQSLRHQIIYILARREDAGAKAAVQEILTRGSNAEDKETVVEEWDLKMGSTATRAEQTQTLISLLRSETDKSLLKAIVNFLSMQFRNAEAKDALLGVIRVEVASHPLYALRAEAAEGLASLDAVEAIPDLERLVNDPDDAVHLAALKALQDLANADDPFKKEPNPKY